MTVRSTLAFLFAVLMVLVGPIIAWPIVLSSTEVGLLFGVGWLVLGRPRWAWGIVLVAVSIDESRSVAPLGMHLLAATVGFATATLAHQKLLSGHSQTQVAVLVALSIVGTQLTVILFRLAAILAHADWFIPHIADSLQHAIPSVLWTSVVIFIFWPMIRRRWVPLQRISSWL